jgi:archaellum biogenesis ATPase FlaH
MSKPLNDSPQQKRQDKDSENGANAPTIFDPNEIETNALHALQARPKTLYTALELLEMQVDSIPYLVEGLFPQVGVTALVGSSDVGKSTILRQLALCVVGYESDFIGYPIKAKHRAAIYVSTEDDETAIAYLLRQQVGNHPSASANSIGLRYEFDSLNVVEKVDALLSEQPADLVIIDCFADLYGEDMNQANRVRTYLNRYTEIAKRHKCLILFLHHTGKGKENEPPSKNNAVGSHGFEAKMRLVIELRKDPTDLTKKHFCIVKGNYLPDSAKGASIVLRQDRPFWFEPTGESVEFERLVRPAKGNDSQDRQAAAIALYVSGMKQAKIAATLGVQEPAVSKMLKAHKELSKERKEES